jgi:hypothetical protein
MKLMHVLAGVVIAVGGVAGIQPVHATPGQTVTPISCTENTCIAYICTTVPGQPTHCTIGTVPRRPGWGPGYPSEP